MTLTAADFVPKAPTPPPADAPRRLHNPMTANEDFPKKMSAQQTKKEPEATPAPKRRGRPPKAQRAPVAKKRAKAAAPIAQPLGGAFGVYDDGSVHIQTPDCKGRLSPEQAKRLKAFLDRLGVKA